MLKTQPILFMTCKVKNNIIKSTFRNFSQNIYKSKTSTLSTPVRHKCFLRRTILNITQISLLSKLTSASLTKDPPSVPDSYLDGVINIDDPERKDELLNIVKLLLSHGCSEEEVKTKCLPCIIKTHSSYLKVKLLTELHSNIVMLMPLLSCHIVSLRAAAKHARQDDTSKIGFPNRLEYLSQNFKTNPADLIPLLSKHPSLLTMPFQRLHQKMTILKEAQIDSEYLVKDLWIFNYNVKLLEKRISTALKAQVELKPWMLRCSEKFFDSILIKCVQTQDILKGDDEVSYLAKKLDCSEDYVKVMMEKNKLLKTINIPKLEQVLTFLFSKGYTPQEVRLFPRVFCSSVQTLSKRFEDFRNLRATLPTMSQLCFSSKNFEKTRIKRAPEKKETKLEESNGSL